METQDDPVNELGGDHYFVFITMEKWKVLELSSAWPYNARLTPNVRQF